MSNHEDSVKLITETIQENLTKFIGKQNAVDTRQAIQSQMTSVLTSLAKSLDLTPPFPSIDVQIDGSQAHISFLDPKTNEQITLADWISRSYEGFYE